MAEDMQEYIQDPNSEPQSADLTGSEVKSALKLLKGRNKRGLITLDKEERKRVGAYIFDLYESEKGKHDERCKKLEEFDDIYRIQRSQLSGTDDDTPNYRMPLTTVAHETIHSNVMNVFFTPKDIFRALPTAQDDIAKVNKLDTFGNWSMKNEMKIFEKFDTLDHSSAKNGECPYMVYWKKEYATEIKREMKEDENGETLYDEETMEPLYDEVEQVKLVYNGPVLEILNRTEYMFPSDSRFGETPPWEIRFLRKSYDSTLKDELSGIFYNDTTSEIDNWLSEGAREDEQKDYEDNEISIGKWHSLFLEFYGRLRITAVKQGLSEEEEVETEELEDEFIAVVHKDTKTLCALRKNRFPMKQRPIDCDFFIPDSSGRRSGLGIYDFMETPQKAYDALFNQYLLAVINSNSPSGMYEPTGNKRDESVKLKHGYLFPTANAQSAKLFTFPGPNSSMHVMLELVNSWSQMMFGISSYMAGMESTIDPGAPAKKAELVVGQGNVRMNIIIKRRQETLKNIFKRWFLLYKDNMPPNKFMRIVGSDSNNPFEFKPVTAQDFAFQALPDFELIGNVLNSNKSLEINKALAMYNVMVANPLFQPNNQQGLIALHKLTKWLLDKLDEFGLSQFLPELPTENQIPADEENGMMLQLDEVSPKAGENHVEHIRTHAELLQSPMVPLEVKALAQKHIRETVQFMQQERTQMMAAMQTQMMQGGQNGRGGQASSGSAQRPLSAESGNMGVSPSGVPAMPGQRPAAPLG